MAKQRPEKSANPPPLAAKPAAKPAAGGTGWSYGARLLTSLVVVWHLFAVFISPFAAFNDPRVSPLLFNIASSPAVRWYSEPMYVAGGYQFFSPDPPRSGRLIRYSVTDDRGEVVIEGEFPNRSNPNHNPQWPRLWYHRHMMLADQMGEVPIYRSDDGLPNYEQNRDLSLRGYARHLLRKHQGAVARVELVEHFALFIDDAWPPRRTEEAQRQEAPLSPTDPRLYQVLSTVTETADRLAQPLLPEAPSAVPESIPLGVPVSSL